MAPICFQSRCRKLPHNEIPGVENDIFIPGAGMNKLAKLRRCASRGKLRLKKVRFKTTLVATFSKNCPLNQEILLEFVEPYCRCSDRSGLFPIAVSYLLPREYIKNYPSCSPLVTFAGVQWFSQDWAVTSDLTLIYEIL